MISAGCWARRIAGPRPKPLRPSLLGRRPGSTLSFQIDKALGRLPVKR